MNDELLLWKACSLYEQHVGTQLQEMIVQESKYVEEAREEMRKIRDLRKRRWPDGPPAVSQRLG